MIASATDSTHPFNFIVFDRISGEPLVHGRGALDALDHADQIGPDRKIEILAVVEAGAWIWDHNIYLSEARSLMNKINTMLAVEIDETPMSVRQANIFACTIGDFPPVHTDGHV